MNQVIPLSLYVHIPWCVQKCPYCDFNSHSADSGFDEARYIDALLSDLDMHLPQIWGRPIRSVFIGGGTPSLISGPAMQRLISELRARLALGPEAEITLEANPGTADSHHFEAYREAGVNRLSLGIQSLDDRCLQELGRIHNAREALAAVDIARRAGFDNINLDMMFGLPGQSVESAQRELESLLACGPAHVSYYQLTLEPNTLFHRHPPALPDEDAIDDIHQAGMELLARHGYERYEISAFARDDRRCLHNTNYWTYGDYLGIGAGAHSKISHVQHGEIRRLVKQKHPQHYLRTAGSLQSLIQDHEIPADERPFEFMMNGLRLIDGVARSDFEERTWLPWQAVESTMEQAAQDGLMEASETSIQASERGIRFLNDLVSRFLPD